MVEYLEIGQIVNTFGIRGQVKVRAFTDNIKRFDKLSEVYVEKKDKLEIYKIENVKYSNNIVIIKFKDINTIEEAEKLKGFYLKIDRKDAPKLPKDTYFIVDLLGLDVYTDEGNMLGKVEDIYNAGSSDIYVVKDKQGKQLLLPAIPDVLKDINLEKGIITVHIIEGLI